MNTIIRTRFAPSPTGFMHVGNLRSALYEFLVAKSQGGQFVLRIEDTDQERLVEGATDRIYQTLEQVNLLADEGPNVGGPYAPYIQSERLDHYLPYAKQLIEEDKAYYCFCSKERLSSLHENSEFSGYDRHCRNLSDFEIKENLDLGKPYVIRQKMPLDGKTTLFVFSEGLLEGDVVEVTVDAGYKFESYGTAVIKDFNGGLPIENP